MPIQLYKTRNLKFLFLKIHLNKFTTTTWTNIILFTYKIAQKEVDITITTNRYVYQKHNISSKYTQYFNNSI
jgi:hypothetical protein